MKLYVISLLAVLAAGFATNNRVGSTTESKANAPAVLFGSSGLLTTATVPISRSFRCPIVLSAANNWTAATTVPSGMAFAMTSLTLTASTGLMTLWDTEFERRQLRIVGGVCVETMSLPNALVSPSQMGVAVIPLNARKFEFDPPLLVHPDDPFSIEITSVLVSNGAPVPISQGLGNSSLSLVIGGYVLYPGEY